MTTYKLITDFSRYTADGFITFGNHVYISMTNNAPLAGPTPPLDRLRFYIDKLASAQANIGINKKGTVTRDVARDLLEVCLKSMASWVQEKSINDPVVLLSSGFELVKDKSSVGPMPMPVNLGADCIKGIAGSVKLAVDVVPKANGYNWYYTEYPLTEASVWQSKFSTAANITLALKPRTEYIFRVAALGSDPTITQSEMLSFFVI